MTKTSSYTLLNYAVGIFFLTTPLESVSLLDNFSLAKLSSIFVLGAWLFSGMKVKKSRVLLSYLTLLLSALASALWSINTTNTIIATFLFLLPTVVVSAAALASVNEEKHLRFYLICYVIGCLVVCASCLVNMEMMMKSMEEADRVTTMEQNENVLAYLLDVGISIVLYFLKKEEKIMFEIVEWILLLFFSFVLLATGSRMGGVILAVILLFYLSSVRKKHQLIILFLSALVGVACMLPFLSENIIGRFGQTGELIGNGDFSQRGNLWSMAWNAFFFENTAFGVGYGNYKEFIQIYYSTVYASHNTYLSYIIEFGFVGCVVPISVLAVISVYVVKIVRMTKDVYALAFFIPLLMAMFVLETSHNRWLFIIGVMIYAWYKLLKMREVYNEGC